MWTLSMDNDKFKEIHEQRRDQKKDIERFIKKHKKVQQELKEMAEDVQDVLKDIEGDLKEFGKVLDDPKYKAELQAIANKVEATNKKIERNLKFDDEGLNMWRVHMNNEKIVEIDR